MDYLGDAPDIIKSFLMYHENILGHSRKTIDEYYLDLRMFFRYLKRLRALAPDNVPLEEISIADVDLELVKSVRLSEFYDYLSFLSRERERNHRAKYKETGLKASSRARKVATIRSFYKYHTQKTKLLEVNPLQDLDSPKIPKSLPRYLDLNECQRLLDAVDGKNSARDYCILNIFLNCGLRISEIVGLNLTDIAADHLRVMGKGGKERVVFLNDSSADAINGYLIVRRGVSVPAGEKALFLSSRRKRIGREAVHSMVKKTLLKAGLDSSKYSSHKLRHTAATLMLKNGVDVRTLQELLGHEHLNTTQIYTHVDNAELRTAANANPLSGFIKSRGTE